MQIEVDAKPIAPRPRFEVPDGRSGKYLIIRLGNEEFGIPVLHAREILNFKQISPVPTAPPNVKGVINLRGRIIPIVDLEAKFRLPQPSAGTDTGILVVQTNCGGDTHHIGIPFERVIEVMDLETADVALRTARILLNVDELLPLHDIAALVPHPC